VDLKLATAIDDENPVIGDLALTDGQITLTQTLAESVAQHLTLRLSFFLGEWFLDPSEGIPYQTEIFVKNPNLSRITSIYRKVILGTPGVSSLNRFEMSFDAATRELTISTFEAVLSDGTTLTADDFGPFVVEV
jgi:hypothetical protein